MMDSTKRILIVDDDLFLLDTYAEAFKKAGFAVTSAKDGQEAWELLEKGLAPQVVFTGIMMPRMTGFELIQKMQADPRFAKIPVAISSHYGKPEHRETARTLGVREFIFQALTPITEAVHRINALVEGRRSFLIQLFTESAEERKLMEFLNDQQGIFSPDNLPPKVSVELEPAEPGMFRVQLKKE